MYKIVGIAKVDFTADDGKHIKGTTLYYTYAREHVTGSAAEKAFCGEKCLIDSNVAVGVTVDFTYNKYGKVQQVFVAK